MVSGLNWRCGSGAENDPRLFPFANPCAGRFTLLPEGGVKECHPGWAARLGVEGEEGGVNARPALLFSTPRLFGNASFRFPPNPELRWMARFAAPAVKPARLLEKKRCEPKDPLRIVEGLAVRLLELKLSREGFTGMRPVIALACRNESSLNRSWRCETVARPNSVPPIEENPPRTRSFRNASSKFEKRPTRPSGEKPSWRRPNSVKPTTP